MLQRTDWFPGGQHSHLLLKLILNGSYVSVYLEFVLLTVTLV